MLRNSSGSKSKIGANTGVKSVKVETAFAGGYWKITARDKNRKVKWIDYIENLVVYEGLDRYLDSTLVSGKVAPAWYVGLTDSTPVVAPTDTMASHPGWTEVVAYSEGNRQAWIPGAISGQAVNNNASPAVITINADNTTIGGAFLTGNPSKGVDSGDLQAAGAFQAGDKLLDSNDTLTINYQLSQAALP